MSAQTGVGSFHFYFQREGFAISAAALLPNGSVVLAGSTTLPNLPVTADALQRSYAGGQCLAPRSNRPCLDGYLVRLSPTGALEYATYAGSVSDDFFSRIAVEADGSILVTGSSGTRDALERYGVDLPPVSQRGEFLLRLEPSMRLRSLRYLPAGISIATMKAAPDGSIAFVGFCDASLTFPEGAWQRTSEAPSSCYWTMAPGGSSPVRGTFLSGPGKLARETSVVDLAFDREGNVYLAGGTASAQALADVPGWRAVAAAKNPGAISYAMVLRMDAAGTRPLGIAIFGGEGLDQSLHVASASSGDVVVAGSTGSRRFPVTDGAPQTENDGWFGASAGFLVKLDAGLANPVFSTLVNGEHSESIAGIAPHPDGSVTVFGTTNSPAFPATVDAAERCHQADAGNYVPFVARISANGRRIEYASRINLSRSTTSLQQVLASGDRLFLAGSTGSVDLSYLGGPAQANGGGFLLALDTRRPPAEPRFCIAGAADNRSDRFAPGQLVTIFGSDLGPEIGRSFVPPDPIQPLDLLDIRVLVNGEPTALLYAQERQINALLPVAIPGDSATVEVIHRGRSRTLRIPITLFAPGLFRYYGTYLAAANRNGIPVTAMTPAAPGDVVKIYGTGFGPAVATGSDGRARLARQPVIRIGTTDVEILFAGQALDAPPGVTEIEFRVPEYPAAVRSFDIQLLDELGYIRTGLRLAGVP